MTPPPTRDRSADRTGGDRPTVSLVIPTLGRPGKLGRTLASVARVVVPAGAGLEVLVVDNGPSDRTRAVVEDLPEAASVRFRYLPEATGGAARARNRGVAESRGEVLAFTDDDCLLEATWLEAVLDELEASPRPDVLGGRVELHDPRDAPVTVRASRERRVCDWTEVFSSVPGCNFCVRRQVFAEIGAFDERLGPGTPLRAAEDADFLYRAHRAGFRVVYSPRPAVRHDHGRRTREEVAAVHRGYVIGRGGFYCKHVLGRDPDVLRLAWWELRECLALLAGSREQPETAPDPAERIGWLARGAGRWILSMARGDGGPDCRRRPRAGGAGARGEGVPA